jgi:hypothetical protein
MNAQKTPSSFTVLTKSYSRKLVTA